MRIALLHTPLASPTGGERQVLMLAIELQKRGHDVELFTNEVLAEQCFPELIDKAKIRLVPYSLRYYKHFFGMVNIGKEVSQGGYDIINNHNFPSEWAVFFAKIYRRTPAVWMCNEPPLWMYMPDERRKLRFYDWPIDVLFDRLSVRSIDRIVVLSKLMRGIVKDTYHRESEVVRSGADVEELSQARGDVFRERHRLKDAFILLQVGSLVHYKRPEDSVNALSLLRKRHDAAKLIFIGPEVAETKRQLLRLIDTYHLSEHVLFLGPRPDSELKQAYAACDIFLFPSFQSWSLVATEAMASKKPVIVSDRCGVSEVITNGMNGFVARHGDYNQIAAYADALVNDKSLRDLVSRNAFEYVRKNLTWQRYAENMESVFEKTIVGLRRR